MNENESRSFSLAARLAKIGVDDASKLAVSLSEFPDVVAHADLIDEMAISADPNNSLRALLSFVAEVDSKFSEMIFSDASLRARFIVLTGSSIALSDFFRKHPNALLEISDDSDWESIVGREAFVKRMLKSVDSKIQNGRAVAGLESAKSISAMRVEYRKCLVGIAARDLLGVASFEQVSAELSWLADAVIETALAIAWAEIAPVDSKSKLAVIAMGKSGGQELNYISDVDVIFVAGPIGTEADEYLAEATKVATRLMQICVEPGPEPSIWEVDPNLRPEGKAGALVRSLEGHIAYYERWAETWEYQALLKARAAAGDPEIGAMYVDAVLPFVWQAAARTNFVADVQAMRQRVISNIPVNERERQLKLGVGGLRDVEFAVQLLQLVHGRNDVMLRSGNTMQALEALANWGYVGREDAAAMAAVYRFERTLEHRIQLFQMRRTHLVPEADADLRRIGRSMGFKSHPAEELEQTWKRHKSDARRLHEKLFYRPLLNAVARLGDSESRLSQDAAEDRLRALGFNDPETALRHLAALSQGVTRRAAIQKTLLPVMLQWMAETPNPDAGLLAFRRVSDELGATPWYLRLLRDESVVAERMAKLLSTSKFFTDLLLRTPESVSILADESELIPRSKEMLQNEMQSIAKRQDSAAAAVTAIRSVRQRELIRLSAGSLTGNTEVLQVGVGLSDLTDATVQVALDAITAAHFWDREPSLKLACIGLGRWGGRELNFGSDADAMFVYEALSDRAAADAVSIVSQLQQLLAQPAIDPPLELDLDLRPEGKQGAIARSLDSYQKYYERWSLTWESQALLRARFVAGDSEVADKLLMQIDSMRYPLAGLTELELREIRRIKARVESERLPRGADPAMHVKLGPGGISDVEWSVQLLQLQHAGVMAELRSPTTTVALDFAVEKGLLSSDHATQLMTAWVYASRIRNTNLLATGKENDSIPNNPAELRMLTHLMGEPNGAELIDKYRRFSRRSRKIMEEIVYGDSPK